MIGIIRLLRFFLKRIYKSIYLISPNGDEIDAGSVTVHYEGATDKPKRGNTNVGIIVGKKYHDNGERPAEGLIRAEDVTDTLSLSGRFVLHPAFYTGC